jgi:S-DNA-T family DNA segregation ATPase FtsK/SpoIIIE
MSTILLQRQTRQAAPKVERGEFPMQEPPALPETTGGNLAPLLMGLPMAAGSGVMMLVFIQPGSNRTLGYLAGGLMAVAMVAMLFGQLAGGSGERKNRLKGERRDYLRYLGQVRRHVRDSMGKQRAAALWTHPDPDDLWRLVTVAGVTRGHRLWERRSAHDDFAEVRIGLGQQRLALRLEAPQTKPVEDLEPLCASALRRFLRAYTNVSDLPVPVYLRGLSRVVFEGDEEVARGVVRAMLAQLAVWHSPDELQTAVCAAGERLADWDWVKWLPHTLHPFEQDAAGPVRLVADSWAALEGLLDGLGGVGGGDGDTGATLADRGRFEAGSAPSPGEPYVVVVLDGGDVPAAVVSRLAGTGYRNLIFLDLSGTLPAGRDKAALRLRVSAGAIEAVSVNAKDVEKATPVGRPDQLSLIRARGLARQLAPYRMGVVADSGDNLTGDVSLTALLGAGDAASIDPAKLMAGRSVWDHLRVPIGVTERGEPVELDLKESALGGMGPHGILIGATGSGKSETIRTLVLALAMTHSSERLNLVLVDFKGGATFLGLEHLPHVSAVITNLADELPLVDRMQDALSGELMRRQELLRAAGHSSANDYEKARSNGAALPPLPSLVIIVDEFGELLATKSEFMDLFVMIGRLGRSLGVHLLLASQRLEEGRIHALDSHLSYRIGLRMFSASESRSVIGNTDAYDKPIPPGSGFLRTDSMTLVRFNGAYVSAVHTSPRRGSTPRKVLEHRVVPFGAGYLQPTARPEPEPEPIPDEAEQAEPTRTVLQVIVDRLKDAGPPAHRVWLPPLDIPATLDQLLPRLGALPKLGFGAWFGGFGAGSLKAAVGLIDLPFEQRREPLVADLEGARGHLAVVGAPQAGKSTLLRTVVAGLALTHTPADLQFYMLDFGGGVLNAMSGLPHIGSVAGRLDRDRVARSVNEVLGLLNRREQTFQRNGIDSMASYRRARRGGSFTEDPYGDVFLVIDGWGTFHQEYEDLEGMIQEIASRGLTYGIHLMVAATRWTEIRPWLRDMLQTRFELRLGDASESEMDFRAARTVPEAPGRGLTPDKFHYLTALPRIDGRPTVKDLAEGVDHLVAAIRQGWSGPAAPAVRLLPDELAVTELPAPEGDLRVAIGWDEQRLEPVWHDFATTPHLAVFGDTETGKTNLLRLFARAITERFTPDEARILVADPRRTLRDAVPASHQLAYTFTGPDLAGVINQGVAALRGRMPAGDIAPDRLARRDWWTGPRLYLLIDDYDLISGPMDCPAEELVDLLASGAEIGLHVVVARTTSNSMRAMGDSLIRRLMDLGSPGMLFSCPRNEMGIFDDVKPRTLPAGRAQLVRRRRGVQLIQTALIPADDAGAQRAA